MTDQGYYDLKKLVNTYKLLQKRHPPTDQEYVVHAYFLYSEPKDGIHGKHIYLGGYPKKSKALEVAHEIIRETGHDCVRVMEACWWEDLDEKKRVDRTLYMDPRVNVKDLERQYREKVLREAEEEEGRELISQELDEQSLKELDPTSMEHYAHNWYNAICNKSSLEYHREKVKYYEETYQKRVEKIRKQHQSQPNLDSEFLPVYEERMKRRKETDLFLTLKVGHEKLREEILKDL